MPKKQFLEIGEIVGTHGIKGELRVYPWSDTPEFLLGFKRLYRNADGSDELSVESSRKHGGVVLMKLKDVDSVEAASRLRGKTLYMNRDDVQLDEDRYYWQDLIGCEVVDAENGKRYGVMSDVSTTGANDVWHVRDGEREYLVPAVDSMIGEIDIDAGIISLRPIKGIFDDAD